MLAVTRRREDELVSDSTADCVLQFPSVLEGDNSPNSICAKVGDCSIHHHAVVHVLRGSTVANRVGTE